MMILFLVLQLWGVQPIGLPYSPVFGETPFLQRPIVCHNYCAERQISRYNEFKESAIQPWTYFDNDELFFRLKVIEQYLLQTGVSERELIGYFEKFGQEHKVLVTICSECHRVNGIKPAEGVSTRMLSHGYCTRCLDEFYRNNGLGKLPNAEGKKINEKWQDEFASQYAERWL